MAVSDLTNTTWEFNEQISEQLGSMAYINFISNNETFTSISFSYEPVDPVPGMPTIFTWRMYYDSTRVSQYGSFPMPAPSGNYKTISITGGTDVTSPDLISWLEANATQVIAGNAYEITHSLSHITAGPFTIHIEPDTGYTYPESVTVTNGTLVSYDSTTGTAVVEGDDTTVIEAECVNVGG